MIKGLNEIQPVNYKPCGKRRFGSRKIAKKSLKDQNQFKRVDYSLSTVYFCDSCQAWHTTSMTKQRSRDLTRHNDKRSSRTQR